MKNRILDLKSDYTLKNGLKFKAGQQFEIVMGVLYMSGYPVPGGTQAVILKWIEENPTLFNDVTKLYR